MNDMGECYDGSREFIVHDVHMSERTEELMDKSRKEELFPTALFVSEIWEHGTSIHRYDCCDDFNATVIVIPRQIKSVPIVVTR